MIDSDHDGRDHHCDHCGMDIGKDGYAVTTHRDGRVVRVHTFTAGCLAALTERIADLEAENAVLRTGRIPVSGKFVITTDSSSGMIYQTDDRTPCDEPGCDEWTTVTITGADGVTRRLCAGHAGLRGTTEYLVTGFTEKT